MSKRKFDTVVENALHRFQKTEFLVGDVVEFIKNWENDEWTKRQSSGLIDKLKEVLDSGDNILVTAIKALHDDGMKSGGNAESPDHHYCDIVQELAPGRYTNVMTVPVHFLKRVDIGNNRSAPIPDKNVRKSGAHIKPEEVGEDSDPMGSAESTGVNEGDKDLPVSDTNISQAPPAKSYTTKYLEK